MNFKIRPATEQDFESILQLLKRFAEFIGTPEKVTNNVDKMLNEKSYFNCLVACDDNNKIIGFATYFYAYYSWTGKTIYLDDLYVLDEFRGKTIGTSLFDAVIAIARNEQCENLKWQVSNWNKNAINFYKSKGAEIDEVEVNCSLKL